jgi:hypothetical protein
VSGKQKEQSKQTDKQIPHGISFSEPQTLYNSALDMVMARIPRQATIQNLAVLLCLDTGA